MGQGVVKEFAKAALLPDTSERYLEAFEVSARGVFSCGRCLDGLTGVTSRRVRTSAPVTGVVPRSHMGSAPDQSPGCSKPRRR
jgi:hypothetical protein